MGSCISKFNSNKKNHVEETEKTVQDKLVISQANISFSTPLPLPVTPKPPYNPFPLSPTSSTSASSISSCYCATSTNSTMISTSNVSLSSSISSSIICPTERSMFSNDYLRSCVTKNPQAIKGRKMDRCYGENPMPNKNCGTKVRNNISTQVKPIVSSPRQSNKPKKRSRANSPNLTRQKSFRKEQPEIRATTPRTIRSPSPTQRFNGENYSYKATLGYQTPKYKRQPYDLKENSWFNYNAAEKKNIRRISSSPKKILSEYVGVNRMNGEYSSTSRHIREELAADHEDINNPHIALDCFIFI